MTDKSYWHPVVLATLIAEENSILKGELVKAEHVTILSLSVNSFCLSVRRVHRLKIKDPGLPRKMALNVFLHGY